MAKVSFSLVQNRFIAISFYHKFGRFRTLTGQTIDPKFWNQRTGRARFAFSHILLLFLLALNPSFFHSSWVMGLYFLGGPKDTIPILSLISM